MAGVNNLSEAMPWAASQKERMRFIFDTGFLSDATLCIGIQRQKVKVHRFVLEFASPILHRDFQQIGNNELIIEDVDPTIFVKFLRYIYLEESDAAVEECLPLLDIAAKYKVQNLIDFCSEKLNGGISLRNVTTLFQQAMEFGHQPLTEATLAYFCKEAGILIKKDCFLELRQACLYEILKRDDLIVRSELDLFNAVLRWGEAECRRQQLNPEVPENVGKVLTKVLGLIRFPNMDAEEFTLNVATRSLLGDKELISLLLFFNVSIEKRNKIPQGRFNAIPRNYKVYTVTRGVGIKTWDIYYSSEKLQLQVNKQICLVGLKLFVHPDWTEDVLNHWSDLSCNILIESVSSEACLHQKKIKNINIFRTIDLESVELEPNSLYQITLSFHGAYKVNLIDGTLMDDVDDFYFAEGLQRSCDLEYEGEEGIEKVHFEFSRKDSSGMSVDQGFITELIFQIKE